MGYDIMDLSETSTRNYFDIHYYLHGEKEPFAADSLQEASVVTHQTRYFLVGAFKADEKGQQMFYRIKTQCLIMKYATGETKGRLKIYQSCLVTSWSSP
jgi:hypothetical protein